jgi:hypothetical protein
VPLLLPRELERRRVVRNDDSWQLGGTTNGLPEVRREDRLGRDLVVAEEPVRRLQLGVVKRLREALGGSFGQAIHEETKAPIQALVAQIDVNEVGG